MRITFEEDPPKSLYPSTSIGIPQKSAGFEVDPQVEGRGTGSTFSELITADALHPRGGDAV
jgi:hypothetical protein